MGQQNCIFSQQFCHIVTVPTILVSDCPTGYEIDQYTEAIAKGHVFNDGSKRTALISMPSFLEENDIGVDADQKHIAEWIIDLADGRVTHKEFAPWLKTRLRGSLPAELA
ncbi:type II toxin-antitoxin system death-on-curing family toxin [Microbulbifer sp. 2304DJ12-6]|uniref:type II toxin-antitoxin system death-on-curing family toxin n=1 Tax=Microbulbifer sp. 2304DJ12-6 TaxID=3233340 RepID=UPI0039B12713